MKNWKEIVQHKTFRYIDHTEKKLFHNIPNSAQISFAIDDALATSISNHNSPPAVRLWTHPKTIVLGIPDGRLPYLEDGVKFLADKNYHVVIRNSGGLAVALDEGVLNLSLILPGVKDLSIHDCYEAMVNLIQYMLRNLTSEIEAYEITESYCPGDFDLSINGRKFAGISQRRIKDAAAIQIYLDVEGDSFDRASMIRAFYDRSIRGEETSFTYPNVNPDVMGSLSELLGVKLTVADMKQRAYDAIKDLCDSIVETPFSEEELIVFEKRYEQMVKRNERIAEIL
ncbi:lipoate--protein ligase family protein [Ornithinibacillus halophilus]|uniref:Octanoyl-[GcvH]:protein N-octanoyltransferase n=1 Tax=Ornithinibacillus halophilus TaxID=930117 RepID=A0A1M5LSS5_9BACI|nr:lipoate--protein ligase family protein [Ornithinibacillus halophilus]SHG68147.1 octanoyl-[GcvH]:protein N-octanoyltransferase/lipoyl amidotransferase [Ornithinibacillus halophilus]